MINPITRAPSRRRSPAICALLLLAFLCSDVSVQPVRAYEFDHYAWTYYLALQVGFTKRQAFQIASGAYALDWWPVTSPMEATTWDGIFGANHAVLGLFGSSKPALAYKWRDLHAFADETLVNGCSWSWQVENPEHQCLATIMKPPLTPENTPNKYKFAGGPCTAEVAAKVEEARAKQKKWLMGLAVDQGNPGALMHFVQDYYAHFEWDTFRGHPAAAHLPDHLSFSRAKALCATRDSIKALQEFQASLSSFHTKHQDPILPQNTRVPDMDRILVVLTRLIDRNPIIGSWVPWQSPTNVSVGPSEFPVGGPPGKTAVPSPGRSVTVIDEAMIEDEASGQFPRWPKKLGSDALMPPTFYPYEYESTGRIIDSPRRSDPMQIKVEAPSVIFNQPVVSWTSGSGGSVKLHLKATYTIEGLTYMRDYEDKSYLSPLPVIELDQISDEPSPTERMEERSGRGGNAIGIYTIERVVERPKGSIGLGPKVADIESFLKWERVPEPGVLQLYTPPAQPPAGSAIHRADGPRYANGCSQPSSGPSPADEYDRAIREGRQPTGDQMAAAAMRSLGRNTPAPPCLPGRLRWTVSVQLYGYQPVEKTVLLETVPEGSALIGIDGTRHDGEDLIPSHAMPEMSPRSNGWAVATGIALAVFVPLLGVRWHAATPRRTNRERRVPLRSAVGS